MYGKGNAKDYDDKFFPQPKTTPDRQQKLNL